MRANARALLLGAALCTAVALCGCTNPDAPSRGDASIRTSPANAGEPPAPAPPSASAQRPLRPAPTPRAAIAEFARLYVNWNYRTLSSEQRALAAMSVGPARLSEQQAAASSSQDTTIREGHIRNSGQVVSIAVDRSSPGQWVVVTREQTSGSAQYQGLPPSYHVTLVTLAQLNGGYAIRTWLPQS
jgi:hypothetical protein